MKIIFTTTSRCIECRGFTHRKRYADTQSPCYHCRSAESVLKLMKERGGEGHEKSAHDHVRHDS